MKKAVALLLALIIMLGSTACAGQEQKKTVDLTRENISDYCTFEGTFVDSEYHNVLGLMYVASSTISFQTYSRVPGTFENVEITLRVNIKDHGLAYYWHLAGADRDTDDFKKVEFTFQLPADGRYSHSYPIECLGYSNTLKGDCDIAIVSVSGTFTPA